MRLERLGAPVKYVINMYDLNRFLKAQEHNYSIALNEVKSGRKLSHWIWYIFPQLKGLGHSSTSQYYGITDLEEAKAYLNHPVLVQRLKEITEFLLGLPHNLTARDIFGSIDAMKVKSSMTLFYYVSREDVYAKVLNRFYHGEVDYKTWYILNVKLNIIRQLYSKECERCNEIIDALGYNDATRTVSPENIPLCFQIGKNWFLLDGFDFDEDLFYAYVADLRTGPPDCKIIDAIAIPDNILDVVLSVLEK